MPAAAFYNRERELKTLHDVIGSSRSELIIVYGRRGVGKSALLERALDTAGVDHLFYRATRRTMHMQLEALTDAARDAFPTSFLAQPFSSFSVFLDFLSHLADTRETTANSIPVAIVIDELPYLATVDPGLLTVLQHWWDANKRRPNLKMFLAGSYVAFMERQVLDAQSPLYNRRTGAMRLEQVDYAESALFFPSYHPQQKMEAFAILGGMPSYLEQFDPNLDIASNLLNTALRQNTYLAEEPDWLLLEDLRNDVTNGSVLRAVALGHRKPSDIAKAIGRQSAQDITGSLTTLRDLGMLTREVPITDLRNPRARTSLYYVADNYLDFWYRYIDPNRSLIARGQGSRIWDRAIAPSLHDYVSKPAFERACRQYLWRALLAGAVPDGLWFANVGSWWGAGGREIDVMALDAGGKIVAAGSCKWTNAQVDVSDYAALQKDLLFAGEEIGEPIEFGGEDPPWLFLFSKSGFTERLQNIVESQNPAKLVLVDLEGMYRV